MPLNDTALCVLIKCLGILCLKLGFLSSVFRVQGPGVSAAPSLLNNQSASLASINNISPAIVQKIIAQQPPPQQPPTQQQSAFNQTPRPPQNQPSTAQLRMLVQQIQMAVQAGYLNHQVGARPFLVLYASLHRAVVS